MTALSESIADYENQKQQENYLDASNNKRQDYDNAVNAAKRYFKPNSKSDNEC